MARILITGSTDGLGLEAARRLVKRNHTVYLHAGNQQRAEDARAACPGSAGVLIADFTNLKEVSRLAAEANTFGTFDAIILNAGMMSDRFCHKSHDNVPIMILVNLLAPYILASLLNRPKRLVFVSSQLYRQADACVEDIFWLKRGATAFDVFPAYCDAKLHLTLLAKAFSRRYEGTSVVSIHPGWVATKVGGEAALDSLEDGIDTYIMVAEGDYDQRLTGCYFEPKRRMVGLLPVCEDVILQEKVFTACEEFTGIKP